MLELGWEVEREEVGWRQALRWTLQWRALSAHAQHCHLSQTPSRLPCTPQELGEADLVQVAEAGTCWQSHVPGALFNNATALAAAFPTIRFRFQGGAEFTADPRGYLTSPRANDDRFACLSFFPW